MLSILSIRKLVIFLMNKLAVKYRREISKEYV